MVGAKVMVVVSADEESALSAGALVEGIGLRAVHFPTAALQLPGALAGKLRELGPALVLVDLAPPQGLDLDVAALLRDLVGLPPVPVIAFGVDEQRCRDAARALKRLPVVCDPLASTELCELALVAAYPERYPGLFRTWFGEPQQGHVEPTASA